MYCDFKLIHRLLKQSRPQSKVYSQSVCSLLTMLFFLVPRSVPQNLSLTPQSSSGILAEWNEPSDHETEGIPLEYRVTYQGILFDTNLKVITTSEKRIMLTQLKPFIVYRVFIQAITTLGISNQSESVMARTNPEGKYSIYYNTRRMLYTNSIHLLSKV